MDVIRWVVSCVGLENIASPFLTSHFMLVSYLILSFKRWKRRHSAFLLKFEKPKLNLLSYGERPRERHQMGIDYVTNRGNVQGEVYHGRAAY